MNKKIFLSFCTFLTIFFLTAYACQVSSGLAVDCEGEGDVVCNDDLEAYQCQVATYGLGYYVTRMDTTADTAYCGVEETGAGEEAVVEDEAAGEEAATDTEAVTDTDGDGTPDSSDDDDDNDGIGDTVEDNAGTDSLDATDYPACVDTEGVYGVTNQDYTTKGAVTGYFQNSVTIGGPWTDKCDTTTTTTLIEYHCYTKDNAYYSRVYCETMVGTGYVCSDGACVSSTSTDTEAVTDTDGDGTPDSSDTDDDGDGVDDTVEDNAGTDSLDATDYPACVDTEGVYGVTNQDYVTKGTVTGPWKGSGTVTSLTDNCVSSSGQLREYYCEDIDTVYLQYVYCETVVGTGYSCSDGACVSS